MSLLLDALRRAAATRDDPKADRYTVPHRPAPSAPQGLDEPAPSRADNAVGAPPAGADPDGLALVPAEQEVGAEPSRPPDDERPAAESAHERTARPAREPAAADSLLRAGAPRRRARAGLMLGLAGSAVLATGALAGGGWLWYQQSRQQIDDALGTYRPQLARAQAAAAARPGEPDAPATAGTGPQAAAPATASETSATPAREADGSHEPPADRTATNPAAESVESEGVATESSVASESSAPISDQHAGQTDASADPASAAAPSPTARSDEQDGGTDEPTRTADGGSTADAASTTPAEPPEPPADAAPAVNTPGASGEAGATAEARDERSAATPRQALALVQTVRGDPLAAALDRGYRALQAADLAVADEAYGRALRLAPDNRDALLGAAAVHQRRGRSDPARRLYQRVLDTHPRDTYARAALTALDGGRPRQNESELKLLLRDNPAAPALHFTLGNLYAAESRWAEARGAYARAAEAAPDDPDFAYNLAIALDHLGQRDAARLAYSRALGLSVGAVPEFDANVVRQRLYQLRRGG